MRHKHLLSIVGPKIRKKIKSFVFRCDANEEVALGHLKRCLSLAHALEANEAKIGFACFDDPVAHRLINQTKFTQSWLPNRLGKGSDIEDTINFAREMQANIIIIDSYEVDISYFNRFNQEGFNLVYFEDKQITNWPVSGVINGLIGAEQIPYKARFKMLGQRHFILGREYWKRSKREPRQKEAPNLLITMGGIDHYNLTSRLIHQLDGFQEKIKINVVIGQYYKNIKEIEVAVQKSHHDTAIHHQPNSLVDVIRSSDLAVSAGGITLYELASQGVPTVGIWLWENQRLNVERLGEAGAIFPLAFEDNIFFDKNLAQVVGDLIKNSSERDRMSLDALSIVDGMGAKRVANKLLKMVSPI